MRDPTLMALIVLVVLAAVLLAYAVRTALEGRAQDGRITQADATPLLGLMPMEAFHWAMRGVGRVFVRLGISPDALTVTSLVVTAACLPLCATGDFEMAGIVLVIGSAFDAFDGIVARSCRRASHGGALLDAVVDRYADSAPLFGLILFFRASLPVTSLLLATVLGATMTSYVRAKAETFGLDLPSGVMRRHERIVYVAGALIFGPAVGRLVPPELATRTPWLSTAPMLAIIGLVGILSNYAAIRLVVLARRRLTIPAEKARPSSAEPA